MEHLKLDFLNLLKLVSYTFRGLFNCKKLTIDNSDLGTIQPKAMSGMLGVQELNIINSKIDKIHETEITQLLLPVIGKKHALKKMTSLL